jgi:hypothetical protein
MPRNQEDIAQVPESNEYRLLLDLLRQQSVQLNKIEALLIENATQNMEIAGLKESTTAMWKKMDNITQPGGVLSDIQQKQAACPGNSIKAEQRRMWAVMGAMVTAILALLGIVVAK